MAVDLVVAPGAGMLFGRLVDGMGAPLAGVRPTFLITGRAGRLEGEEITLGEGGSFHLPYVVRDRQRGPFRLEIRRDDVRPTAGLGMTLPTLPAEHVTDLGELRIDAFGEITDGTVVDDRGLPIVGAAMGRWEPRQRAGATHTTQRISWNAVVGQRLPYRARAGHRAGARPASGLHG